MHGLLTCSNQLFHTCGNSYHSTNTFQQLAAKDLDKLPCITGPLSLSLSLSAIVAANGEVTEVMNSEKEKAIKTVRSRE